MRSSVSDQSARTLPSQQLESNSRSQLISSFTSRLRIEILDRIVEVGEDDGWESVRGYDAYAVVIVTVGRAFDQEKDEERVLEFFNFDFQFDQPLSLGFTKSIEKNCSVAWRI